MLDISVAIHTYNRSDFLCETLDSVLQQQLKPREIILVDDGSTDDTEAVVAPYLNRIVYEKIANVGCGASRDAAAARCRGEWVACSDDDDLWAPDHLEKLAATIEAFPDSVFVFSNFSHFGPGATPDYDHFSRGSSDWWETAAHEQRGALVKFSDDAYRSFLEFNPACASTWAFRRSAFEAIGGFNDAFSRMNSEDADFTRRMLLYGQAACTWDKTVSLRRHDNNMSEDFVKNQLGKARILEDHVDRGLVPSFMQDDTKAKIDETLRIALRHSLWSDDPRTAFEIAKMPGLQRLEFNDRIKLLLARLPKAARRFVPGMGGD